MKRFGQELQLKFRIYINHHVCNFLHRMLSISFFLRLYMLPACHYVFITIVSLALLNSLCLFSFVNIQPEDTFIGSRNALPKLCIATLLLLGTFPAKSVVFIFSSFFPIDCPVVDSKYNQYAKNNKLWTAYLTAHNAGSFCRP